MDLITPLSSLPYGEAGQLSCVGNNNVTRRKGEKRQNKIIIPSGRIDRRGIGCANCHVCINETIVEHPILYWRKRGMNESKPFGFLPNLFQISLRDS